LNQPHAVLTPYVRTPPGRSCTYPTPIQIVLYNDKDPFQGRIRMAYITTMSAFVFISFPPYLPLSIYPLAPPQTPDQLFRFRHLHEDFTRSGVNSALSLSLTSDRSSPTQGVNHTHTHSHETTSAFLRRHVTLPVTGRGGPWGCETSRLSHCLDNRLTDGGEVVCLMRRPAALYPHKDSWYSFLFRAESTPGP
jgi:hypothetical protein